MDDLSPHVLMLPFPTQGHINPFITLARLLSPFGFCCTIAIPQHLNAPASSDQSDADGKLPEAQPVSFARVSACADVDNVAIRPNKSRLQIMLDAMENMREGCRDLLLQLSSSVKPVSCIITDSFVTWGQELANQFDIRNFILFTSPALVYALFLHTPSLLRKGLLPVQDPEQKFYGLDGVPSLCARELPRSVIEAPQFVAKQVNQLSDSAGVIFNTVEEFEGKSLQVVSQMTAVYPIGPMMLMGKYAPTTPFWSSLSSLSMWAEDRQCLSWLDTMPTSSVLYVSFGSVASLSVEQIKELAEGLDASGTNFLWVIRPNSITTAVPFLLPDAFEARTNGRGLVISWAPQLDVLSHPAVGGFLTHSGWNSITENLSLGGVPMICWPHGAEQRMNAKMLVDVWGIGLDLLQGEEGLLTRDRIESTIRELMLGESGKKLRRRAGQFKDIATSAVQEGGTSFNYLNALLKDMQKRG